MKIYILLFCTLFISSCGIFLVQEGIKENGGGDEYVCDSASGLCDSKVQQEVFLHTTLESQSSVLNKNYPAPDFVGLENWMNSDGYASIEDLRGQVVLVDFWTLGCVNCIRTLPHLVEIYEQYRGDNFQIVAIHAPEFAYEQKLEAVKNAVEEYSLPYPIVQDNDFMTWRAYKNRYWPAHYIIDKNGNVRYTHFGEGKYEEMRQAIEELLAE